MSECRFKRAALSVWVLMERLFIFGRKEIHVKRLYAVVLVVVISLFCVACADEHTTNTGAISADKPTTDTGAISADKPTTDSGAISADKPTTVTGAISGSISPEDASVRIIAKTAGTDYAIAGNIKGEVTLTRGGNFTIEGLPAGTYDLIFFLQGESAAKYLADRWSEVVVKAGESTSGISYRLTPQGSEYMIDDVLVSFSKSVSAENAQEVIRSLGCIIKDSPIDLGQFTRYVVDIPNDKSVDDMIVLFMRQSGVLYAEPNRIATAQNM